MRADTMIIHDISIHSRPVAWLIYKWAGLRGYKRCYLKLSTWKALVGAIEWKGQMDDTDSV